MLYKKPDDMKYTDMAIYVDQVVKRGNPTKEELELVYQYLYHIIFMLAHKGKYFNQSHYYEEFAIFLATEVFNRLFYNPKLEEYDEGGKRKLKKIKSCLNYIKAIIYGRKVVFEQQNYSQKFSRGDVVLTSDYIFNNKIRESLTCQLECDMSIYLQTISKVIHHYVYKNSPYKNDPILLKNIYISCMFTLLNEITLTEANILNIKNTYSTPDAKYKYVIKIYDDNKRNSIILYHLPDNQAWYNYITVLVRQINKVISEDIKELSATNISISDNVLSELVYSELDGKVTF